METIENAIRSGIVLTVISLVATIIFLILHITVPAMLILCDFGYLIVTILLICKKHNNDKNMV